MVASSNRGFGVATVDDGFDLVRFEGFRQAGKAPVRNPGNGSGNIRGDIPTLKQIAEKAAQSAHQNLYPARADLLLITAKEAVDVIQCQRSEIDGLRGEPLKKETVDDRQIVADCDWAQTTVVAQEGFIPVLNPFRRALGNIPRVLSRPQVAFRA